MNKKLSSVVYGLGIQSLSPIKSICVDFASTIKILWFVLTFLISCYSYVGAFCLREYYFRNQEEDLFSVINIFLCLSSLRRLNELE